MKPTHQPNYRAEIDGLRAFAVLAVVIFHAFPSLLQGGFVGVDVFFVISGFLITSHIFEKLDEGEFSFIDFFSRRIRRIFPSLILVMAFSLILGWFILLSNEYASLGRHIASGAAFFLNFILASEVGYFDVQAEFKPMLHLWSLSVEEQFYIIWPLCLWLAWKGGLNLFVLTLIVLLLSFFVNMNWVATHPTEVFFWPFGRFWELLTGSVLAWVTRPRNDFSYLQKLGKSKYKSALINSASCVGLALLAMSALYIGEDNAFPSMWAVLPVLGTLLIIVAGGNAWFNRMFLKNPVSVWFGLISYPLYLWHWVLISYTHITDDTPHRDEIIFAVLLSILLAWLTYKFIEIPIRFKKGKEALKSALLIAAMLIVGGSGFLISQLDLTKTHTPEKTLWRKGLEHQIGYSSQFYHGTNDWLFIGNGFNDNVAKLKLAVLPTKEEIEAEKNELLKLSEAVQASDTKIILFVGPNKSTIYPEYLPPEIIPSNKRYFNFFAESFTGIPNFILHDPTHDLRQQKESMGKLYYRTDTHWNSKGAFLAFKSLADELNFSIPNVEFEMGPAHEGDIIGFARLKGIPLHADDNWNVIFEDDFDIVKEDFGISLYAESFGERQLVTNKDSPSAKSVWVIGDSFQISLRPYIDATFREVYYVEHWHDGLEKLLLAFAKASKKPDLILIVRVERSF